MLNWAYRFNIFCFLDNHRYAEEQHQVECLLGAGAHRQISPSSSPLEQLEKLQAESGDWLFGHLAYDLKNSIEPLQSDHTDTIGFPDLYFFVPEIVVRLEQQQLLIGTLEAGIATQLFEAILSAPDQPAKAYPDPQIESRFTEREYLQVLHKLKEHIVRGDCYEINFCQEFFAENCQIDPLSVYRLLSARSPNPFSCFYRLNDKYLLCASPERFLQKQADLLCSQPIKGTSPRDLQDPQNDEARKQALQQSRKDRTENVMVVDLVRNDLSRVCIEGSVQVEELFGIYSFPQVHQMISTIKGKLRPTTGIAAILRACFPMGSMTGAPKRRVMELIEEHERSRRGLFSGAVGYIQPNGDFDFNVVIRSILYNETKQYLSFQAGSAITFQSDPEAEYAECLLKAAAIKKVLAG